MVLLAVYTGNFVNNTVLNLFYVAASGFALYGIKFENAIILHRASLLLLFLFLNSVCLAQEVTEESDTIQTTAPGILQPGAGKKIIPIESYSKRFDPRKALLYSAILPGAGQAYNKSYWKLPLVYGGFATTIYVISFYQGEYNKYKSELFSILNEPGSTTSPSGYTEDQLRSVINTTRRQRDFFTALTGLWYILQMVEAHVDAH